MQIQFLYANMDAPSTKTRSFEGATGEARQTYGTAHTHTHTERERRQGYEIGRGWINVIDVDQCDPHWAVAYGSSKFGWQRYMEPI
jgi:hypothetical protein